MRKKFLVNPAFQLRHVVWTLVVAALCFSAGYGIFEGVVSRAVHEGPIDLMQWYGLRLTLRWGFLLGLTLLLGAIGIESYFFSHSVAGPLFALERGLRRLAQGDFRDITRIRETDQLGELIQTFDEVKAALVTRLQSQESTVQLLSEQLNMLLMNPSRENLDAVRVKLKEIRELVEKKAA